MMTAAQGQEGAEAKAGAAGLWTNLRACADRVLADALAILELDVVALAGLGLWLAGTRRVVDIVARARLCA